MTILDLAKVSPANTVFYVKTLGETNSIGTAEMIIALNTGADAEVALLEPYDGEVIITVNQFNSW